VGINGACQTATIIGDDWFEVYAMLETVNRTNFKAFQTGTQVNLELPLALSDPLGGHLVAGHVDITGQIKSIEPGSQSTIVKVAFTSEYSKYLIEKGSVAIDGISLTVFDIQSGLFSVSLIPETLSETNLKFRKIGEQVNLEFDQIGKYVENFINAKRGGLTIDDLNKHGYMR
ncbi:MAG: riboflavin synthase, partial [candidate division Zixibacteria bacterium]|nr:riboflavin synthase [candidate division Zixibacteria bacterium]